MTDPIESPRVSELNEDPATPARRSRSTWIAAALATVVAAGSVVGAVAWNAQQNDAHTVALGEWRSERARLAQSLADAHDLWDASEQVDTSDVGTIASGTTLAGAYTELKVALDRISDMNLDIDPALSRSEDVARAREVVAIAQTERRELERATLDVNAATTVHAVAGALVILEATAGELTEALDGARGHLSASEGGTLDDAARGALSEVIDAAAVVAGAVDVPGMVDAVTEINRAILEAEQPVRKLAADGELRYGTDPVVHLTSDGLVQTAAQLREHVAALAAARQAVHDAQATWQAEQDRLAEEARAAESARVQAAQRAPSSSSSAGSSTRARGTGSGSGGGAAASPGQASSSTGSSSKGTTSSGSSNPSGAAAGGGGWVESDAVQSGANERWCTDTAGGSWRC